MAKKESAAQAPAKKKKAVEEARPFTEAARLRVKYNEEVVPQLKEKFGYTNVMQIPKLEKIVLNMGLGSDKDNPKGIESFDDMAAGLKDGSGRDGPHRRPEAHHNQGQEVCCKLQGT